MTKEEILNKQWEKHKSTTKQYIFDCMEEYAKAKAGQHETDVVGQVEQLKVFLQWAEKEWMETPPERQWSQMFDEYFKSL